MVRTFLVNTKKPGAAQPASGPFTSEYSEYEAVKIT